MIVARIDGGLGNQMFQYAYGYYLAKLHDTQLHLDLSSYRTQPAHGYLLDRFQISGIEADERLRGRIPSKYLPADQKPGWYAAAWHWRNSLRRHKESPFGYHHRHLQVPDERYLVGYWQSEQFFPGIEEDLQQQFQLSNQLSPSSRRIAERMETSASIALHVRRGDYVTTPSARLLYSPIGLDYYRQCVFDWASYRSNAAIFVFSNDLLWCRQNLSFPWPVHYVEHNNHLRPEEDLVLLSRARCCVIANSTFSWWAAWLNRHADKTVFAPRHWFQPGSFNDQDIVPTSWIKVQNHSDLASGTLKAA